MLLLLLIMLLLLLLLSLQIFIGKIVKGSCDVRRIATNCSTGLSYTIFVGGEGG